MQTKKIFAVLGATAITANMIGATVFAQQDVSGSQTIDACTGSVVAPVIDIVDFSGTTIADPAVVFENRNIGWYNDANPDAPLNTTNEDTGTETNLIRVSLFDDRGYDPDNAGDCGNGISVSVIANDVEGDGTPTTDGDGNDRSLQHPTEEYYLDLEVNTLTTANLRCIDAGGCLPTTLTDVASVNTTNDVNIAATAQDVLTTSEAFFGTMELKLSNADLSVIKPGTDPARKASPTVGGDDTDLLLASDYTGTITFDAVIP